MIRPREELERVRLLKVASRSVLRVELFGSFRVVRGGRVEVPGPTARQQQLLAYLILHSRDAAVLRQRIAGALWPDSTDQQALTNLRRELHHLRDEWPDLDRVIEAGSRTLTWCGDDDVHAFEQLIARAQAGNRDGLVEAARAYKGDLLPDFADEWIEVERTRLRQTARTALLQLINRYETENTFADAVSSAEQLIRIDPLCEDAWCALMRCHARQGDRATALQAYQECAALLKRELGVQPSAHTRMTYREVLDLDTEEPAVPSLPQGAVYPLVGRDQEWRTLLRTWRQAEQGRARLLVLRGEAGIGKSRLAEELIEWCRAKRIVTVAARCYAGEGRLAYAPIAAWLRNEALQPALASLQSVTLTDVARLHPAVMTMRPDIAAPYGQLESWQRLRFFDAVARSFRAAAPLVLVVDDLQWADADTIDWMQYFVQGADAAGCLIVGTVRAEEEQDNPPLGRLLRHVAQDGMLTIIPLGPLDRQATAQLADAVAEHPLDDSALARTFRDTEGHPLFIVERGRMEAADGMEAGAANAHSRVQSVVAARLALLSPEARAVAEVAAAVGRDFSFDILTQALDFDEATVVRAVDELWRRHIVRRQADAGWDFTHDRIREVAYSGIGPARAPLIHRRIAHGMELLRADRLDDVSALIAVHLDRGGQPAQAVPFLQRAAVVASQVSANEEAIRCLNYALSLLGHLPQDCDRDQLELTMRSSLSIALNSARGYADVEVERNIDRVFDLSRTSGDGEVPVRWLWVAFTLRFMLGDLDRTREVAEKALARVASDPYCRCEAHHAMAGTLLSRGELEPARAHFESALAAYDEAHPMRSPLGSDLGVFAHAWYSHALWLLGDDAEATAHVDAAIALARRFDHPYSETLALAYASLLYQMRGDAETTVEYAESVIRLCERFGFAYYDDWARVLIGWARGREHPREGVERIEAALARLDARRAQGRRPYYMSLLADTCRTAGDRPRALSITDAAIAMALERSDLWWLPALYFQKSELEQSPRREVTLQRGLDLARAQGSRSLERRILAAGSPRAVAGTT